MADDDQLPESEYGAPGDSEDEQGRRNLPDRPPASGRGSSRRLGPDREIDDTGDEAIPVEDDSVEGELLPEARAAGQGFSAIFEHSGPLPPVSAFRGYEEVQPGAADRILKMAEAGIETSREQVASNNAIQYAVARSIDGNTRRADRQQWIYVGLMTSIVTVAAVLAWFEKTIPAVLLAVVSLAPGFMLYDMYRNAPPIVPAQPEKDSDQ